MVETQRQFPVLGTNPREYVPWVFMQTHEAAAKANHYQTLERLAERGGLSWTEIYMCVTGTRYRPGMRFDADAAERFVREAVAHHNAAVRARG